MVQLHVITPEGKRRPEIYVNCVASTIIIYYLHAINPMVMPNTTTTTTPRIVPTTAPTGPGDPIEVNNLR